MTTKDNNLILLGALQRVVLIAHFVSFRPFYFIYFFYLVISESVIISLLFGFLKFKIKILLKFIHSNKIITK